MLEATFGWLLSRPALSSVIAGATSADQVRRQRGCLRTLDALG